MLEEYKMPTVQRFYVINSSKNEKTIYKETLNPTTTSSCKWSILMHSDYVYDCLPNGTWTVMKDRTNGHWEQVMPSDEDLFMMILSAKSVKDYAYK
tara:strand:+ start:50 stop:337 length:288 start_codon:yes stop_codon:yes gene_type:complete